MPRGVEILMASHNGALTLPRMLAALETLHAPERPWRIIAVDNASTDATGQLLREAADRLPLTLVRCETPGKLPALKAGASRLCGDLAVFTDDDIEPAPDWLRAYEAAADRFGDVGIFGGPIFPTLLGEAGPWFDASRAFHAELFARTDEAEGPVVAAEHLFGPNFMLRTEHAGVLADVAEGLGPTFSARRANRFAMGEDTQIMQILQARGVLARYVTAAAVRHLVRPFQTELDFMLGRAERHGRGAAIRWIESGDRSLPRRLRSVWRELRAWRRAAGGGAPRDPSPAAFERLWTAHWSKGALRGALFGPFPPRLKGAGRQDRRSARILLNSSPN